MPDSQSTTKNRRWVIVLGGMVLGLVLLVGVVRWSVSGRSAEAARDPVAAIAAALQSRGNAEAAARVSRECAKRITCDCVREAGVAAIDHHLEDHALPVLDAAGEACTPQLDGLRAEALARTGQPEPAEQLASATLLRSPEDGHATLAVALVHQTRGERAQAREMAKLAATRGRADAAHVVLGNLAYGDGDLDQAKVEYEKLLAKDPDNVDSLYNLAVVAHREGRYRAAREGYLKVLKLDPSKLDARFNLALLVHSVGAVAEAQHHLTKLRDAAPPGDDRVARLERALTTHPPSADGTTLHLSPGAAPPSGSAPRVVGNPP